MDGTPNVLREGAQKEVAISGLAWQNARQGRKNPSLSKPCFCLSATRLFLHHLRHFRHFRGVRHAKPCFLVVGRLQLVIFAVFIQKHLVSTGDKNTVYQKQSLATWIVGTNLL